MTNALVYHVASGQAFFSGVVLILLAVLSAYRKGSRWRAFGRTVAACLGLTLIAISATPLPAWFYIISAAVWLAWLMVERGSSRASLRSRQALRYAVLAAWGTGAALEIPYHLTPALPRMGNPAVYVVGDSISAGMGGEAETWPRALARRHRIEVHDLSLAGATVATASRKQSARSAEPGALLLAESGGNDVLGRKVARSSCWSCRSLRFTTATAQPSGDWRGDTVWRSSRSECCWE
jgi:acyl-CoA thioesterase-1